MTAFVALDYPLADIELIVSNEKERVLRAGAAGKEPETIGFLESMPAGSTFYDIGSNTGAYSLIAAARGVNVVAFEPQPASFHHLTVNVAHNFADDDILCLPFALAATTKIGRWRLSSSEPGFAEHEWGEGSQIPVWALDDLISLFELPVPEYVKIDVDGFEVDVLKGARWVLPAVQGLLVETCPATEIEVAYFLKEALFECEARYLRPSGVTNAVWRR